MPLPSSRVAVHTVDSFQGSEANCVVLSLVRSNSQRSCGFLKDARRLNVAMTRAKDLLVVLGDGNTLAAAAGAASTSTSHAAAMKPELAIDSMDCTHGPPASHSSSKSNNAVRDWYWDCRARGVAVAFPGQDAFEVALQNTNHEKSLDNGVAVSSRRNINA